MSETELLNPGCVNIMGKTSRQWLQEICQVRKVGIQDPVIDDSKTQPPVFTGRWRISWPDGRVFEGKFKVSSGINEKLIIHAAQCTGGRDELRASHYFIVSFSFYLQPPVFPQELRNLQSILPQMQ